MDIDVLIVGQGVCGTFLSREMDRLGLSYLVTDEPRSYTASKVAAGIINPITGKRLVKTWIIDELLPFAHQAYREAGASLGISCLEETSIIDFFVQPDARLTFHARYSENPEYLQLPADENAFRPYFEYDFGYGIISPCYLTDLPGLLAATRADLKNRGRLLEEKWAQEALVLGTGRALRYRDIRADRVILCDGIDSFHRSWFNLLPFSPNKGEALIAEIPGLPPHTLFKRGINLVPLQNDLYWIGSSYEWSFTAEGPTEAFRNRTEGILRKWLRIPFKTVDHIAAIRPATLERRPFVGFHPLHPAIGILNGMGTKGCSLAPYFARQLAENMVHGTPILPEADVRRFTRVLSRAGAE